MLKTVFVRSLFVCCHKYTATFPLYPNVELTPKTLTIGIILDEWPILPDELPFSFD